MATNPAPSCKKLLAQATALWPERRRDSDGIVPSASHTAANPTSDHEVGKAGYNHAVDLSHDPANGCDCAAVSERIRVARDPRVKYVIFSRRIFSSYATPDRNAWAWGPYGGSNPHTAHMHVSILDTKAACEDVRDWPLEAAVAETPYWVVVSIFDSATIATAFQTWCAAQQIACVTSGAAAVSHGNDAKSRAAEAEAEKRGAVCPFGRIETTRESWKRFGARTPYKPRTAVMQDIIDKLEGEAQSWATTVANAKAHAADIAALAAEITNL